MTLLLAILKALLEVLGLAGRYMDSKKEESIKQEAITEKAKKEKDDEIDAAPPASRSQLLDWMRRDSKGDGSR